MYSPKLRVRSRASPASAHTVTRGMGHIFSCIENYVDAYKCRMIVMDGSFFVPPLESLQSLV